MTTTTPRAEPMSNPCNSTRGVSPQAASTLGTSPAQSLVNAVHRNDQVAVQRILRRPDLPRIAADLALRCEPTPRPLEPCGTRAAAERHISHGELVDDDCAAARRAYFRNRARAVRARQREAPTAPSTDYKEAPRRGRRRLSISGKVDPVVVERLTRGNTVPTATTADKYAAYVHIRRAGMSPTAASLALRLSSTARTLFAVTYQQEEQGVAC